MAPPPFGIESSGAFMRKSVAASGGGADGSIKLTSGAMSLLRPAVGATLDAHVFARATGPSSLLPADDGPTVVEAPPGVVGFVDDLWLRAVQVVRNPSVM
jgi:hypothetical protein